MYINKSKLYIFGKCLLIFIISRFIIIIGFLFGKYIPLPNSPGIWIIKNSIFDPLLRWDVGWYLSIINDGYQYNPLLHQQQNIAFFPLYPILVRELSNITGITNYVIGIIISNLFLFIALCVIFFIIQTQHIKTKINPYIPIFLICFFPMSFFYSTLYTESLFLMLAALTFYFIFKNKIILASIFVGFASATRNIGILLLLPIIYKIVFLDNHIECNWKVKLLKIFSTSFIGSTGLMSFILFQYLKFGQWNAFIQIQHEWGRKVNNSIFVSFGNSFHETIINLISINPHSLDSIILIIGLILCLNLVRKKQYYIYLIWIVPSIIIPLSTGTTTSLSRYIMVLFPLYIYFVELIDNSPLVLNLIIPLSSALLAIYSALYSRWIFVG